MPGSLLASLSLAAVFAGPPSASASASAPAAEPFPRAATGVPTDVPDLGIIRYRDPKQLRQLWLGLDGGGAYVPESLGLFSRTVWTARVPGAWALALTPWLAVGGRHQLVWYDAENIRLRVHTHQLELSGRPLAGRNDERLRDRLALGFEFHTVRKSTVGDSEAFLGGIKDVVLMAGYGFDHLLSPRWRLGWNAQLRYVWVFIDTQRQVRASLRPSFYPRPDHRIALEVTGYLVNRETRQFGNPLPRTTVHGQASLGYDWISMYGIGPFVQLRFTTGFLSGEAPIYEIREEALNAPYGEALIGLRAVWN